MNNYFKDISGSLVSLSRFSKQSIAIITDISLCILCTWLAFFLRLEELIVFKDFNFYSAIISVVIAIPIFWMFGIYRTLFRYTSISIISNIILSSITYGLLYFIIIGVYGIQGVPRSIGLLQPILLFLAILTSRLLIKNIFQTSNRIKNKYRNKKNVLIYGAGNAGRQLLIALENSPEFIVAGFLDDNRDLQRQNLLGKKIYSLNKLEKITQEKNVNLVFLALPSINRQKRNYIISELNKLKLQVKTLPSIQQIVDGKISISDIKDLSIDDLLSRDQVQPNLQLLYKNIHSKIVLVTGAGGSIGSELCNQIVKLNPKKLILLELNEFALYKINERLRSLNLNLEIIPLLANIQNPSKIEEIFKIFKIDTVYHAAAYKHVPLVEENICESVKNNVIGTFIIATAAIKNNVSNFVLISSDKAVRPTNIMGATKRLAEICVQSLFHQEKNSTKFAIVRFGNVLQSSGSVIPKIKKQIREGGPVTLTHPEVTRYFMTVIEASQLVIQAGSMSDGCDVFVLDMGESIKIKDLIYKMIRLSGLTVKNNDNKDGDIEVRIVGLRPGEKLYEELLIGENPQKTYHEKIQKATESFIPFSQLKIHLDKISSLIEENNEIEVKDMLKKLVTSYQSNSKIVDNIYIEKKNFSSFNKISKINFQENKVVKIKDL